MVGFALSWVVVTDMERGSGKRAQWIEFLDFQRRLRKARPSRTKAYPSGQTL